MTPAHAGVAWFQGTWPQALQAARSDRRAIVADFYSRTCAPCVRMDKITFADSTVTAAMREFICFRLDGFSNDGRPVARSLKVGGWPTLVVFDSTGQEIDRHVGYLGPTAYLVEVRHMLAGEGTIPDLRTRAAMQPQNPHIAYTLGRKLADRGDPEARSTLLQAIESYRTTNAGAGSADSAWWVIADLAGSDSAFGAQAAAYESLLACCPRGAYAKHAKENLPDAYHALGRDSLAVALLRDAVRVHPDDASASVILGEALWDWSIDRDEGLSLIREAVRTETKEPTLFMVLSNMEQERSDLPRAIAALRHAIACCGENTGLATGLTRQLSELQRSLAAQRKH